MEVSQVKLFLDDPSLFAIIQNKNITAKALETDLEKIDLNLNPSNQAQEVVLVEKHFNL